MSRFGEADRLSDLDLIIVAESGQCDALWEQRSQISELVHGGPVVWSQEPSWQRPYRYQTWDEDLIELDLALPLSAFELRMSQEQEC